MRFLVVALLVVSFSCTNAPTAVDGQGQPTDIGLGDLGSDQLMSPDQATPDVSSETSVDIGPNGCNVEPYDFQCPCEFNPQCGSGWCIAVTDDVVDSRCTRECDADCPDGYGCQPIAGAGDPVYLCVPEIDKLCDPCFAHGDCLVPGDLCVQVESATYCARNCETTACPDGYTCSTVDGGGQQCLPNSGSCVCPPGVDLTSDPEHCSECGNVCEFTNALADCVNSTCRLGPCEVGFWDTDGVEANGCEYECDGDSNAEDAPDSEGLDTNCDGIDGDIGRAVFVAPYGDDDDPGTKDQPVQTIMAAIVKTNVANGVDHVYIAAGSYTGQVVLADGVSLYGGYSGDGAWTRSITAYETILLGVAPDSTEAIRAVVAVGLTLPSRMDGLTVQAANNPSIGGSSYALYAIQSGGALTLADCRLIAGSGGPGTDGQDEVKASDGVQGQPGKTTTNTDFWCNEFETYGGFGGAPGTAVCDGGLGGGGKGADSGCGDDDGSAGDPSPDGTPGGPKEEPGTDGAAGVAGAHGAGGAGGTVVGNLWLGANGVGGTNGTHGKGGGGGGSGDGHPNGLGAAIWGGGGGGGASAGCGGVGAQEGTAGGGSFGVFLIDSSPVIENCEISSKNGGNGGNGGTGGPGGSGRPGGPGGLGHENSGDGGKGGDSGPGGAGGHGGGGAGGPSFQIFVHGASSPKCVGNTFLPLGVGGIGGVGGTLDGNAGSPGQHAATNAVTAACDPANQ